MAVDKSIGQLLRPDDDDDDDDDEPDPSNEIRQSVEGNLTPRASDSLNYVQLIRRDYLCSR